jgi:DNA-binding NtrC family response regulator
MINETDILLGQSTVARALDGEITAAARSDAKVLVTGESGCGKEVSARLIHHRSARRDLPFVALNCAGVPDSLLESELFGHVRGAFTDAYRDRLGLLESAKGGTVFLDEIGEMSLRMQALLLRFLESGEIQRVGADHATRSLDVRIICATNRSLPERVAEGSFRADLYYRLHVVHIHVPPLRDRKEDLPQMADHFRRYYASRHGLPLPEFDPEVLDRFLSYSWPGNIRELRNVVERLVVRARDGRVTGADLPAAIREVPEPEALSDADGAPSTTDMLADRVARNLFGQMRASGVSFWDAVHAPFLAHDITRDTVRRVVRLGLAQTGGRHIDLVGLFNIVSRDYRRLVTFLRKHDCLEQPDGLGTAERTPHTSTKNTPADHRDAVGARS